MIWICLAFLLPTTGPESGNQHQDTNTYADDATTITYYECDKYGPNVTYVTTTAENITITSATYELTHS